MTLYIYRVGWTYPARNPVYRSKSIKISSCTRTLPGPVRPVGPTGQTGRPLPDRPQRLDRSDRSVIPVRPVGANFGCQHWEIPESRVHYQWRRNPSVINGSWTLFRFENLRCTPFAASVNIIFLSHQISTNQQSPASQQYFSLTINQHQLPPQHNEQSDCSKR